MEEGASVVLVARTTGALEEVDDRLRALGGQATLVPCDLTQSGVLDRLGGAVFERFGRLDILVGNAGDLGVLSPAAHIDPEVWRHTFAVNVEANFGLIRSFDALLRASDAGRAVFVTCEQAAATRPFWSAYAASKAALERVALDWAEEVKHTPLKVNIARPPAMRTRLRANAYPSEDPNAVAAPETFAPALVALCRPDCVRHGEIVDLA